MNDWRLQGQEKYLMESNLVFRKYKKYSEEWQHDHCEFCSLKFSENPKFGAIKGYSTLDGYRWVCSSCFHDFKERFKWILIESENI